MDFLRVGWVRRLMKSAWFPLAAQAILLVVFALFVWGGWGIDAPDPAFAKVLRNTNLANLVVWSYWFPLLVVGAVVLGRVWCTVCPVELVAGAASRVGLRRPVPAVLKSGWAMTVFYGAILLVGIHTLGIHRIPHRMALYLVVLMGSALAVSLVFEKRAFCSWVCPVGYLLGLYSECAVLQWRAADKAVCDACATKDCIAKKREGGWLRHSCTSWLYPPTISDNRDCLLCTQCLKVCPNENLRLSVRFPGADLGRSRSLTAAQAAFVLVVSGFVVYEILSEWEKSDAALRWLPDQVIRWLGLAGASANLTQAVLLFVVGPAALFLGVSLAGKVAGRVPMGATARGLALALVPTMAAAHVLKAALKMTSRLPYWRLAMDDLAGVEAARQVVAKTLTVNTAMAASLTPATTVVAVGGLLVAIAATVWLCRRAPAVAGLALPARAAVFLGAVAYWGIFAVTVYLWRL